LWPEDPAQRISGGIILATYCARLPQYYGTHASQAFYFFPGILFPFSAAGVEPPCIRYRPFFIGQLRLSRLSSPA
jgi:hypothetical protein